MNKFPFCHKAGFDVYCDGDRGFEYIIDAEDVENFLAESPVVYGYQDDKGLYDWNCKVIADRNQSARLILIEPIQTKTREGRLEEALKIILGSIAPVSYKKDGVDHFKADFNCSAAEILERIRVATALLEDGE